jgi:NAD(P)-dependent dehydrogenase (short-subunit alcohol dehydrogenase family)
MRLEGKVAIVTGGGQGIGRAIALTFAKEGSDVAIFDIIPEAGKKVVDEIKTLKRKALFIKCDVSNSLEVNQATKKVLDDFGKIDILVNNAGIAVPAPAEEATEELWDKTININLKGPFLCSQAVGRQMIKQRHGKIINIASTAATVTTPLLCAYAASKGGVLLLTRALAGEWGKYNINVNAVSPGLTETDIIKGVAAKAPPGYFEGRVKRIPLKRLNQPQDIANTVLFLASSESDNISGESILVDGGVCSILSSYVWPEEQLNK